MEDWQITHHIYRLQLTFWFSAFNIFQIKKWFFLECSPLLFFVVSTIFLFRHVIELSVFRPLCSHTCVAQQHDASLTVSRLCGRSLTLECLLQSLLWGNCFEGFYVWTLQYLRCDKMLCSALCDGLGVAHVSGPYTFQSHAVIWTIWLEAVQAQMCRWLCLGGFGHYTGLQLCICNLVFFKRLQFGVKTNWFSCLR